MNSIILIPQIAERIFMRQSRHLKEDGIVSMTGVGWMAGFPHLYYYGNPRVPARFLKNALEYKKERRQKKDAEI